TVTYREGGFKTPPSMMARLSVVRLVNASVLVNLGGQTILTDPWFNDREGLGQGEPLAAKPEDLPRVDAIVISHTHSDHYDMSSKGMGLYPYKEVPIIVPRGEDGPARAAGFTNVREVNTWEEVRLTGVRIVATPGRHDGRGEH